MDFNKFIKYFKINYKQIKYFQDRTINFLDFNITILYLKTPFPNINKSYNNNLIMKINSNLYIIIIFLTI